MDDNLGVRLSIAVPHTDQGQTATEKGPVPELMSSIIQMGSLLSLLCATVHPVLSQAALRDTQHPYFNAISFHHQVGK